MKPLVFILKYGSISPLKGSVLGPCMDVRSTVGLIVYEKDGAKKGMVVDAGRGFDWPQIEFGIKKSGLTLDDISHVLITHQHLDHLQNLSKFTNAIAVTAGSASFVNKPDYGANSTYQSGSIEIPEVVYIKAPVAHTNKDTVYVVDSQNEGKVAFLGDLIFAVSEHLPQGLHIALDKSASIDPLAKYLFIKDLLNTLPDVGKFYAGHNPQVLDREDIKKYSESLRNQDFQNYLKVWYENRMKEMNEEYKKITAAE